MSKVTSDRLLGFGLLAAFAALASAEPNDTNAQIPADTREQVWAIRLAPLIKEPPGWTAEERHQTIALAFSPDDKRLAVTVMHAQRVSERDMHFNTHLFVIDVRSPETNVQQFDLPETCGADLTWNDRGDVILVCGTLLRLAQGTSCTVNVPHPPYPRYFRDGAHTAFWLDSDHVVRRSGAILDLACKHVGTWPLEPTWTIAGVAASRGWVSLWHTEGPRQKTVSQFSIMDRDSHQALSGWPTQKVPWPSGGETLAVGAEAWCFILHDQNDLEHGKLHCRAINGGTEIPVPKQVRGYKLTKGATSSARVVLEKWERHHYPWWWSLLYWWFPFPGYSAFPVQRAIFNLRSGNCISSWKVRIQDWTPTQNWANPDTEDYPYHYALSALGEYVAESGDGGLELYRLAP